jgi:hypothetical protein
VQPHYQPRKNKNAEQFSRIYLGVAQTKELSPPKTHKKGEKRKVCLDFISKVLQA